MEVDICQDMLLESIAKERQDLVYVVLLNSKVYPAHKQLEQAKYACYVLSIAKQKQDVVKLSVVKLEE